MKQLKGPFTRDEVMAYSHYTGTGTGLYRNQDWHNRKQWVLVPVLVSDQSEHFYMVLYFPFGPCTGPYPCPIPAQCEYIMRVSRTFKSTLGPAYKEFGYKEL